MRVDSQAHVGNSLDGSAQGKASLVTSRRSLLAGSKLVVAAGVTFGLGLAGRSSSAEAQTAPTALTLSGCKTSATATAACKANCFLAGTRIKTTKGEVRVEELRIGDRVLTVLGRVKPIKFVGHREIWREPSQKWNGEGPVKISRFAIDGKAPHSDLYVSPAHAIYIDGVMIPVSVLVNGITVVANAKPDAQSLSYFHIELDTHEAILAEGLAVESFQRNNVEAFDNADEYVRLYGSPPGPLTPFAPIVSYYGGRQELASYIRSALAPVCDFRKPIDKVRDRIADLAECAHAA
jgi:Hint domain